MEEPIQKRSESPFLPDHSLVQEPNLFEGSKILGYFVFSFTLDMDVSSEVWIQLQISPNLQWCPDPVFSVGSISNFHFLCTSGFCLKAELELPKRKYNAGSCISIFSRNIRQNITNPEISSQILQIQEVWISFGKASEHVGAYQDCTWLWTHHFWECLADLLLVCYSWPPILYIFNMQILFIQPQAQSVQKKWFNLMWGKERPMHEDL